jgi:hypothetical protein
MDTILTLKLDGDIIEQAKTYARKKNTSLSKLIELYLGLLIAPKDNQDVTPLVKSLFGVINIPKSVDYKKHLLDKYSK